MKTYTILLLTIFLLSGNLSAQTKMYTSANKKTFNDYASFVLKEYGIVSKRPKNFIELNHEMELLRIRDDNTQTRGFFLIGPLFKVKDKECVIGYDNFPLYTSKKVTELYFDANDKANFTKKWRENNSGMARKRITSQIKTALGLPEYLKNPPSKDTILRIVPILYDTTAVDFDKYVTTIIGKKARKMFNADTIFLLDISLPKPYQGKYPYCRQMIINKKDRVTLIFNFFFTSEGKKKDDEYINMLSENIWYEENFKFEEE